MRRYLRQLSQDEMPSRPSLQAWAKTVGPSASICSLNRMPDVPWQSVPASAVRRHKLFSWLMDAHRTRGGGKCVFGRNRLGIRAAHSRCECQVPARRCQAAGRGAQIILVKKAPTESGLQVRSHLPEGKPARKARAGRAKLKLHGFAGPSPGPLVGVQTARVQRARNEPEDR
jgi:hypothetical protein